MRGGRRGLTLVEVLMTIGVIGVLLTIVMTVALPTGEKAKRAVCLSNLRSLFIATESYRSDHQGMLPLATRALIPAYGWLQPLDQLAPYLSTPIPSCGPMTGCSTGPPFVCPSDSYDAADVGASYMYFPFNFMTVLGQRGGTEFYREAPRHPVFLDNPRGFHRRALPGEHRDWRGDQAVNERGELGWIEEVMAPVPR